MEGICPFLTLLISIGNFAFRGTSNNQGVQEEVLGFPSKLRLPPDFTGFTYYFSTQDNPGS